MCQGAMTAMAQAIGLDWPCRIISKSFWIWLWSCPGPWIIPTKSSSCSLHNLLMAAWFIKPARPPDVEVTILQHSTRSFCSLPTSSPIISGLRVCQAWKDASAPLWSKTLDAASLGPCCGHSDSKSVVISVACSMVLVFLSLSQAGRESKPLFRDAGIAFGRSTLDVSKKS